MYSRVTLLEIDTVRIGVEDAVAYFRAEVLPRVREQAGYQGVVVLATPEGKGMIISIWETEEAAEAAAGLASQAVEESIALFRSPPGREYYEVAFADTPWLTVL
jgi:heme-degrading monooxygenase HmoA